MFGFGRKKSKLEKAIEKDGIEHATNRVAEIVASKIPTTEIAYRFILEELDGASRGNDESKAFARSSGIGPAEYRGALENSCEEVDGPDGPQQLLAGMALQMAGNQKLMARFRCKVDEKIMKKYGLGNFGNGPDSALNLSRPQDEPAKDDEGTLDGAYIAISLQIVSIMNKGGQTNIEPSGAIEVAKKSLVKLTPEQIISCRPNVAALFCVMVTANSAYDDQQRDMAEYLTNQCKPIVQAIVQIPNTEYSDLEFTMVQMAIDWMKKVEGVAS